MNPALKNFMKRNNLTDVRDLLSVYEKKYVHDWRCSSRVLGCREETSNKHGPVGSEKSRIEIRK